MTHTITKTPTTVQPPAILVGQSCEVIMTKQRFRHLTLLGVLTIPKACWPCSVTHVTSGVELVTKADAILRVRAVEYDKPPSNPTIGTNSVPDSVVKFEVLEVIRGHASSELSLHGYLNKFDDFYDQPSPYRFVRPGGRSGSCFANSYRKGADYLLFLKRSEETGQLTVNWAALAPVNEELHSSDDPWLLWVRKQAEQVSK